MRNRLGVKFGDTLIEVTLAIGIFSLIAVGVVSVVSGSTSRAQVALEQTLTREEIVKQVLRTRKVKETTILLNLQNKKLFKKVDKNSYTLA